MLDAVVLHRRHWPDVRATIDALLAQVPASRVVIVDNGSHDGSADHLREEYPSCRLIESGLLAGGYAQGMNIGIAHTTSDVVLLLTHDCVLRAGAVNALSDRLAENDEVGAVTCLFEKGDELGRVWSEGGIVTKGVPNLRRTGETFAVVDDQPIPVDWLDGTCIMARRSVLERVPLDEGYFLYYEDVEFGRRTTDAGWSVECVPTAQGTTTPGVGPNAMALWTRNRLRYTWRNERRWFIREVMRVLRWSDPRTEAGRLRLRGLWAFLTRKPPESLYRYRLGDASPFSSSGTTRPTP